MQHTNRPFLGLLGILAALTGTSVPVRAVTAITVCNPAVSAPAGSKLDKPGNYVVTADLTAGSGDCILITSADVSLKLNGHTITPGTSGGNDAIHVDGTVNLVQHVAIEGPGLITNTPTTGFANGIEFATVNFSQVDLVTIVGALSNGIAVNGGCNYLTIGSNVITRSFIGIEIFTSNFVVISGNDASGNSQGIEFDDRSYSPTVNNNIVNGNSIGIEVQDPVHFARIYSNVIDGNRDYGIEAFGAGNQYSNNRVLGNGSDIGGVPCGNFWSGNTFQKATSCTPPIN